MQTHVQLSLFMHSHTHTHTLFFITPLPQRGTQAADKARPQDGTPPPPPTADNLPPTDQHSVCIST